jgi:hypothetical protein
LDPFLVSDRWALILLDEAVKLALDAWRASPAGELSVEAFLNHSPFLVEIDPMIPDEVHLLLVVPWSR